MECSRGFVSELKKLEVVISLGGVESVRNIFGFSFFLLCFILGVKFWLNLMEGIFLKVNFYVLIRVINVICINDGYLFI